MQLYALDDTLPIIATQAKKEKSYLCPECKTLLRLRSGPSRQPHFYHLKASRRCRQSGKSEEHLALQCKLLGLLGEGCEMEAPFPSIGRIADIAWHMQKILFEIQCSPIALEEVQERNQDYAKMGYAVIWILHDKRFNKKTLCAAEKYVRTTGCYFTNIDKEGQGEIYDQFEIIAQHRRLLRGAPLVLNPTEVFQIPSIDAQDIALPKIALERLAGWKYHIAGDLLHRLIQERTLEKTAKTLLALEEGSLLKKREKKPKLSVATLIRQGYRALLQLLLKNTSA